MNKKTSILISHDYLLIKEGNEPNIKSLSQRVYIATVKYEKGQEISSQWFDFDLASYWAERLAPEDYDKVEAYRHGKA